MSRRDEFIAATGLPGGQAARMFDRIVSAGYSDPGKWHASRIDSLLRNSFVKASSERGMSKAFAERQYRSLTDNGYKPYSWHASRVASLQNRAYIRERSKSVDVSIARKEAEILRSGGVVPSSRLAKNRSGAGGAATSSMEVKTMREYLQYMAAYEEYEWEWEEWIFTIEY